MSAAGRPPSDPERDAWLREALRHAPDASASPPPSISDTILAQARAATRTAIAPRAAPSTSLLDRALAFWSWLARPQVAAGFASVMAATLVGMLWWDRPIDEAMLPPPAATPPMARAPEAAKEAPLADVARPPASDPRKVAAPTDDLLREAPLPRQRQEQRQAEVARERAPDKQVQAEARTPKQKDDRVQQTAPSAAMRAPVTPATAPVTTGPARSGADAPAPFPARSPTEAESSSRANAPSVAAREGAPPAAARSAPPPAATGLTGQMAAAPPPPAAPAPPTAAPPAPALAPPPPAPPAQPAPTTPRAEPFALAKKAESSEKENAEAKARSAAPPAVRAPAPTGSLGAAMDRVEPGAGGRATTQNAGEAAARQAAAPTGTATQPMASLLAALALDDTRWSRRLAGGESAAIDASLRTWLAEVQAAAPQWERTAERSARRDAQAAASATLATLRLDRDGRPGAIVQIEEGGVRFEPLGGGAWFALLPPAVVARLRATLPPAPR